jgi:PAS domain S-box-containing protein
MPKKKPIDKRLKNLFEDVKPDQTPAEVRPAFSKRASVERTQQPVAASQNDITRQPVEMVSHTTQTESVMTLAFQAGQNSWATLQVMDEAEQRRWSQDEQLLVKQVADQLSLALENARLFQETQRRAEELAVLNELGNELSTKLDPKGIADVIYKYTSRLMSTKNFYIALYDEKNDEKSYPLAYEEGQLLDLKPSKVTGRGFTDHILRNKRTVFAPENVLGHMKILGIDFIPLNEDDTPSQSWLGVPMMIGDRILGVIAVQSVDTPNLYDEHDRDILATIASQAAIAVENARLFQEAQRRAQETAALAEVGREISATLELEIVLERISSYALELLQATSAAAYMPIERGEKWQAIAAVGLDAIPIKNDFVNRGEGVLGKVVLQHAGTIMNNVDQLPDALTISGTERVDLFEHLMGVPVLSGERVTGLLAVWRNGDGREFTQTELDFLTSLSLQTAIAIENARLFQETIQRQQAQERSEAELRALFSAMEDVIIVYDRDGRYVRVAPTNPALLFRPPEDMIGKLIHEILPKELHEPFMTTIHKVLAGEENVSIEYPLTLGGKQFWFDANASKLTENQVFWVARDITERKQAEDALRESEARTRLILETAIDAFISINSQSEIIEWNPQATQIFGWTHEEAVGRNLADLIIPESYRNAHKKGVQHYLSTGEGPVLNQRIEITGLHRNGHLFPIELAITSIPTAGGASFTAFVRDITERKQAEEALAASQQMLRQVLDTIPSRVFWKDRSLNFIGSNQAFALDAGLKSPEELVGKNDFDMTWAEQARLYQNDDQTVMESRQPKLNFEEPHTDSDGRTTWVRTSKVPLLNTRGQVDGILGIYDDVTAEKAAEEAIRRQNQYLAVSAEIGRLVTSTLDLNTIFSRTVSLISERFGFYHSAIFIIEETGFNAVLREATGEAGEKMKAQRHSLVVGSNSIVGKAAESGIPVVVNDVEHEPLHRPNPFLLDTLSETAIPLRTGTRIVGVIDIQSTQKDAFSQDDISVLQSLADQVAVAIDNARSYELSQQLIKDLREIDQLKSQFLANMSHELRTPLNSIIGFSRVILKGIDGPVTEMQQQDLTAIYNSGQHLLGLINDVLDLARIEAGKMELNFEEVHLAEMTTSVMSTAKGLIKEKPIQLLPRIPADMPTVRGDTMRVRQVLLNLISNASKFTDEGSITVEALVQKNPAGKLEALINVIDTGPGISVEDQEKLFKAFSQVDGSATRKSGGSGLGLSICANLVQLHAGKIGVYSEMGKGSTFWFTLPLYHQPKELIPEGKKVVLAIDDDRQVISLYERYLNPQGYHVEPLTDPSKAKERILELKPFAVTLDIMMPSLDGWTLLTTLKSDPATRDYPVIICSITEKADKGFSLGAEDYLVKPILEEDLVNALDRLNKNGEIHEVLVIDDDPNDLRLIGKILSEHSQYKPILVEGGRKGWEVINEKAPHAIILDIFMPEMDGFTILENLRDHPKLREIPVLVVSGGGLTIEQQQQLNDFGQHLITKGSLSEDQLISSIERALKRIGS